MMRSRVAHGAHGAADHDRRFDLAIRHVGNVRSLLNDLGDRFERKIKKDFVHNGARARHSGADRYARGTQFADAGVA